MGVKAPVEGEEIMRKAYLALAAALVLAGLVLVPSAPAVTQCTGPQGAVTINGSVKAGPGCVLDGTHVTGNVSVAKNGTLAADGATIDGDLLIVSTKGANSVCGTSVGGTARVNTNQGTNQLDGATCSSTNYFTRSLVVKANTGDVTVSDAVVGLDLLLNNNETPAPITLANTSVGRNLVCHENEPPPSVDDGTVVVNGQATEQCVTKSSSPCPKTGCSSSASNDDTSVTVTVPGGGRAGTLTITLSPPPSDDGCFEGGTAAVNVPGSSLVGSVVTVVPPSGYGPGNPIVVDITWLNAEEIFAVCKSNNGKPPFTQLDQCEFDGGGDADTADTPLNVPCWTQGEEPNEAVVYMTSTDPAFAGH